MSSSSALSRSSHATPDASYPYFVSTDFEMTPYGDLASLLDVGLPSTTKDVHRQERYVLIDLLVPDQSLFVALRRDLSLPRAATGDDVVTVTLNVSKPVDITSIPTLSIAAISTTTPNMARSPPA